MRSSTPRRGHRAPPLASRAEVLCVEPRTRWSRPGARRFQPEVRVRCGGRSWPLTPGPSRAGAISARLEAVERELKIEARVGDDDAVREHVFNLLALVLEREPVLIAARAFDSRDIYVRGTALEYLETVLPRASSRRWFRDSQPRLRRWSASAVSRWCGPNCWMLGPRSA